MQQSTSILPPRGGQRPGADRNGRVVGRANGVDLSHLLRRRQRTPLSNGSGAGRIRIRRERRVYGSFTGIVPLARGPNR